MVKRSRDVAASMSKGIEFLFKKNKIDALAGYGKLKKGGKVEVTDAAGKKTDHEAKHIILATGGRSRELPNLVIDGKKIIGYREAMILPERPQKMLVVGSGAIGAEFAYFYSTIGTEVTIVEFLPRLVPVEDEEVSKALEKSFKKAGITIYTSSEVTKVDTKGKGCVSTVKTPTAKLRSSRILFFRLSALQPILKTSDWRKWESKRKTEKLSSMIFIKPMSPVFMRLVIL